MLAMLAARLPSWKLVSVDAVASCTIVRSWHALHSSQGVGHDFEKMLAPPAECCVSMGASIHGEIRAIAHCMPAPGDRLQFSRIAHGPGNEAAGHALLQMLLESGSDVDWMQIRTQPRWWMACSFYATAP